MADLTWWSIIKSSALRADATTGYYIINYEPASIARAHCREYAPQVNLHFYRTNRRPMRYRTSFIDGFENAILVHEPSVIRTYWEIGLPDIDTAKRVADKHHNGK